MIDQKAVEKVEEHISDALTQGARSVTGGKRLVPMLGENRELVRRPIGTRGRGVDGHRPSRAAAPPSRDPPADVLARPG